ncbi:MAG: methyltransferase [Bacteroidota bacterium]|nr:methyltransferase [Bacteroidota bacterium]
MERSILFLIFSIPIIVFSRRALFSIRSHGFYRFLSWECILWIFIANYTCWFDDPFAVHQLISWILLFISVYLVTAGALMLKRFGKPERIRNDDTLFHFEQTTVLIDTGIYKYIRHPLYSSLLFLTWGICLKHPTIELLIVSLLSSFFLLLTALSDEKECVGYFGAKYTEYMKRTRRFIPFIF